MDFQVVILGQAGVGKTSIIKRLSQDIFIHGTVTNSLDKDFIDHKMPAASGGVTLRIWDTAEMERYSSSLPSSLYRRKQGIVLVYSLTDKESLRDVRQWWKTALSYYSQDECVPSILLANKTDDLLRKQCSIDDALCMYNNGIKCFGTSALEGHGITEAFSYLTDMMMRLDVKSKEPDDISDFYVGSSAVDTPFKFVRIMKNCSLL